MAVVQDPAFWKRFSIAVHQDEESQVDEKGIKSSDLWLDQTRKKQKGSYACFCYLFWALIAGFAAVVVVVVIVLVHKGVFKRIHFGKDG